MTETILRFSVRSQPTLCPQCTAHAVEAGATWEAFRIDENGQAEELPICIHCVCHIDERIRIALDILDFGRPRLELRTGEEVPF